MSFVMFFFDLTLRSLSFSETLAFEAYVEARFANGTGSCDDALFDEFQRACALAECNSVRIFDIIDKLERKAKKRVRRARKIEQLRCSAYVY
jgi:hypothetical protein